MHELYSVHSYRNHIYVYHLLACVRQYACAGFVWYYWCAPRAVALGHLPGRLRVTRKRLDALVALSAGAT